MFISRGFASSLVVWRIQKSDALIVKVPRENHPFNRDTVDALSWYGIGFEAVGRFPRGLEFQVFLEDRSDTDGLAKEG